MFIYCIRRYFLILLPAVLPILLLCACIAPDSPGQSYGKISLENVSLAKQQDLDLDGYYSKVLIGFEATAETGDPGLYFLIKFKPESGLTGNSADSIYSIVLFGNTGLNSTGIDLQIPEFRQDFYDFRIEVYPTEAKDFLIARIDGRDFPVLDKVPLEPDINEASIEITDARLANLIDRDQDGYVSAFDVELDIATDSSQAELYFRVFGTSTQNPSPVQLWESLPMSTGATEEETVSLHLSDLLGGEYDLSVKAYFKNSNVPESVISTENDSDLQHIKIESSAGDPSPIITLGYSDGSFETGITYQGNNITNALFAVGFDLPEETIFYTIKKIRIYVTASSNYITLRLWNSSMNRPGDQFYFSDLRYVSAGWMDFPVNIQRNGNGKFYAGYRQLVSGAPLLGIDTDPPHSLQSMFFSETERSWQVFRNGDFGIEVELEYVLSSGPGRSIIISDNRAVR